MLSSIVVPGQALPVSMAHALDPAGPFARFAADLAWWMFAGAASLTALIAGLLWLGLRRTRPAKPVRPAVWLAGGGLVLPMLVLGPLLASALHAHWPAAKADPVITVTAHAWWWEVAYPQPGGPPVTLANEIRIPTGRPVTLGLTSADMLHSLWVPALAGKVDAVPGRTHQLRLQADAPGVWRAVCAEFCGLQHARMSLHVVAMPPVEHERWLAAQASDARPPADDTDRRGLQVFNERRCGACHRVRGLADAVAQGVRAPDLTHVGSRLYIGAGTLTNSHISLVSWAADAHQHKPGVRMPAQEGLDEGSREALGRFLADLQ